MSFDFPFVILFGSSVILLLPLFAVRVAKIWNKLPENITNTPFLNTFKSRLDRFMENEDIYSDFRAELSFKSGNGRIGNNERCMERECGVEDPYRTCTGTHQ